MNRLDFFLVMVAVFWPPFSIVMKQGVFSKSFLLSMTLWIVGFFPCLFYTLYVIWKYSRGGGMVSFVNSRRDNY